MPEIDQGSRWLTELDRTAAACPARGWLGSAAMKIRAAVLEEFGAPLQVQEVDLAEPGPGEVLVRLEA